MVEFELKFQIPPQRRAALRAFVAGRAGGACEERLQAIYFDTADRSLARARMALRLRREGSSWVQTLKGVGDDGIGRDESEVELDGESGDREPRLDLQRHADTLIGQRLLELLEKNGADSALRSSFRSDVQRVTRLLRSRHGTVELAFDEGDLQADGERVALCEFEIELKRGHPMAVIDVAQRWALRHGCWLDMRSKAERGDMLARGMAVAPARKAARLELQPDDSALEALRKVIANCRDQILANASQVASGEHGPEHVHQLRIGLRRLRAALKLFAADPQAQALALPLGEPAARVFRALGTVRDRSVVSGPVARSVDQALHEIAPGDRFDAPAVDTEGQHPSAVELVRDGASQRLLIDLIAVTMASVPALKTRPKDDAEAKAPPQPLTTPLAKQLHRRLVGWLEKVTADAARFDELDAPSRHRLRKRIKRLRYGAEMGSSLLGRKATTKALKTLRGAQDVLGELNDLQTALNSFGAARQRDPQLWFALGWLLARRDALLDAASPAMRRLASSKKRWKKLG